MRVLVTTSRLPFAIDAIRKLGRTGHTVLAADSNPFSPGSRSRYVARHFRTAGPARDPAGYIDDVIRILEQNAVDLVLPGFEDVFFLAHHRDRLDPLTELFAAPFDLLRRLHDKAAILDLARDLGVAVPDSIIARSPDELAAAMRAFDHYVARSAYSRGGTALHSNAAPGMDQAVLATCHPTPENPEVVQRYEPGDYLCTYSIAKHGRVAAHSAYAPLVTIRGTNAIAFESIDDPEVLGVVQTICDATGYHGQISFDFIRGAEGLKLIECNPRLTSGVSVMPDDMLSEALTNAVPRNPALAPPGQRRHMSFGLLSNLLIDPRNARLLLYGLRHGGRDVYFDRHDPLPFFFQFLTLGGILRYRLTTRDRARNNIVDAYLSDSVWDGGDLG